MSIVPQRVAVLVASTLIWSGVAVIAATHQWAELRGTSKELTWLQAFLWQGLSWLLLIPLTPALYAWVRRRPLSLRDPSGAWSHLKASIIFGLLFLFASVPLRLSAHPSAARWSFFGEAIYKSIPAFAMLGIGLYWLLILVSSLFETRARLYARIDASIKAGAELPESPTPLTVTQHLISLSTRSGTSRVLAAEVRWAEPAPAGARIVTDGGSLLVRHTLAQLELLLPGGQFARTHRSFLVNTARIRELIGSPSRDGSAVLDTGETIPVSRRRHRALARLLLGGQSTPDGAPFGGENDPLGTTPDTKKA